MTTKLASAISHRRRLNHQCLTLSRSIAVIQDILAEKQKARAQWDQLIAGLSDFDFPSAPSASPRDPTPNLKT